MNLTRRVDSQPAEPVATRLRALRVGALLFLFLGLTASALADSPPRIDDKGIRIGFPDGPNGARSRNGVWTPVMVPIQAPGEDVPGDSYRIVVETTDGEAVPYRYTIPVPGISANSTQSLFAYLRPGGTGAAFTVSLQNKDGSELQKISDLSRDTSKKEILEPKEVFYLTVGSSLPAFKSAFKPDATGPTPQPDNQGQNVSVPGFASIEKAADLPDRWFGYESVDAIVITTSSEPFVQQLLNMDKPRGDALLDWVRRGGRLVLSVGRNRESAAKWLAKMPLVDGALQGKVTRASLPSLQMWCSADPRQKQPLRNLDIVRVQPGPNMQGMVYEDPVAGDPELRPELWQSSCGLGRVILVAFDLDAPPFSSWDGQGSFWKKLHDEVAPRVLVGDANQPAGSLTQGGELAVDLKRELESFQEMPVIPFGSVALLILLYIVLAGPLDYFLLKKIFKRLELTWLTFPVLVFVVSVTAYAAASYFKGEELRINKIDLVDIDLHGRGQVYGHSWFTLFSPRVRNFTIGVEPAPEWGGSRNGDDADAAAATMLVATMDGPEPVLSGNSQSLFRRPYEYAADAGSLMHVPIPRWATRTFTASWSAPLTDAQRKDHPPPIQAELRISRDGRALSGGIANNLSTELQGVALFFQGQWYLLGDLAPGETREVSPLFEPDVKPHSLQEWFTEAKVLLPQRAAAFSGSLRTLRTALFHGAPGGGQQPNSGLRLFDEGWRIQSQGEGQQRRYRDEAILVARTPIRRDRAGAIMKDGFCPSRLRLGEAPGPQEQRPALSGYLQQETYVRIYIPVIRHP